MKKIRKVLISLVLINMFVVSVQADAIAEGNYYSISIPITFGDHIICYSDTMDQITYYIDYNAAIAQYNGCLYQAPVRKQVITEAANVRTGPGMQFDVVDRYVVNDIITVYGEVPGVDNNGWNWYLTENGYYTCTHLFSDVYTTSDPNRPNRVKFEINMFDYFTPKTACQDTTIRTGPGIDFPEVGTICAGTSLNTLGTISTVYSELTWFILEDGNFVATRYFG